MATIIPIPTTELQAVNRMLDSIFEAPVSTLEGAIPLEAKRARDRLVETSLDIQMDGWSFNRDYAYSLQPDRDGFIFKPHTAITVDPTYTKDIVEREGKLYDISKSSFVFSSAIECDIIWYQDFSSLPEHAKRYIFVAAAKPYQEKTLGDTTLYQFDKDDLAKAKARFLQVEAAQEDLNIFDDNNANARYRYRR